MGRAIVREPAVFLFDEPLSNLDAKLRVQMRFEIQKLHRRLSTTSLYVTHDQVEAMTLAQRMIVMNAGRAEQIGTPMEVYENPATLFVAGLHRIAGDEHPAGPGRRRTGASRSTRRRRAVAACASMRVAAVAVGIRPEHLAPCATADAFARPGRWRWSSNSAPTRWSMSRTAPSTIVARVPQGAHPAVESVLPLAADPARVYIFDGATGARIR